MSDQNQTSKKKKIAMLHGKTTLTAAITKVLMEASNCPPVDFGERGVSINKIELDEGGEIKFTKIAEKDVFK